MVVLGDDRCRRRSRGGERRLVGGAHLQHQTRPGRRWRRVADERLGAGVGQNEADLVGGEPDVDRNGDRPEPVAGQQGFDELDPVVEEQGDSVTGLDPAGCQDGGQSLRAIAELGVRADHATEDHRRVVRLGAAGAADQLRGHQPTRLIELGSHRRAHRQAPGEPGTASATSPATASIRATKKSATVGSVKVWSGRYHCQMLL